jgi:hypothetical protein
MKPFKFVFQLKICQYGTHQGSQSIPMETKLLTKSPSFSVQVPISVLLTLPPWAKAQAGFLDDPFNLAEDTDIEGRDIDNML